MTRRELMTGVDETIANGKAALELVRDTIAPGQWKQLWKNEEFVRLCKIFEVKEAKS